VEPLLVIPPSSLAWLKAAEVNGKVAVKEVLSDVPEKLITQVQTLVLGS
jgi:hypothetical protein